MTAEEMRDSLYRLGLTQNEFALRFNYSNGQINLMARGKSSVPEPIAVIIRLMVDVPGVKERLFPVVTQAKASQYEEA